MSAWETDKETAEAARKAASTFRELSAAYREMGNDKEADRMIENAKWHDEFAGRFEYDDE